METEQMLELERLYGIAAKRLENAGFSLSGPLTNLTTTNNQYFQLIGKLLDGIITDVKDMTWRRKWMEKTNSSIELSSLLGNPVSSKFVHLSNKELLHRLTTSTLLSKVQIERGFDFLAKPDAVAGANKISDQELSDLLNELARRSLTEPLLADQFLAALGNQKLDSLFWRIYFEMDFVPYGERDIPSKSILPLGILFSVASQQGDTVSNYLGEIEGKYGFISDWRFVFLGMMASVANFSPKFLANKWIDLLEKREQLKSISFYTKDNTELKRQLLYETIEPLRSIFKQLGDSLEGYIALLTNPALAQARIDIGFLRRNGIDFAKYFTKGLSQIQKASLSDPALKSKIINSFETLGIFMYQNYTGLAKSEGYAPEAAKLLSLYIPEMRTMATQVTVPLLAPILSNPEAMVIFSGSLGVFTIHHLKQALKLEFNQKIELGKKQRLITGHLDAVSDVHYHFFSAISVNETEYKKSAATFFEVLNLTGKYLLPVLSILVGSTLGSSALIFANKKLNRHILNKVADTRSKLTPTEFFTQQIMNRKYVADGGKYPEPTWFELELASTILKENPSARANLERSPWFDGNKIIQPQDSAKVGQNIEIVKNPVQSSPAELIEEIINDGNSTNGASEDFARWFAHATNADPPTEFSSTFTHIQREFGRDILLDALAIEIAEARKDAQIAKATAEQALEGFYTNLRTQRGVRVPQINR